MWTCFERAKVAVVAGDVATRIFFTDDDLNDGPEYRE